MASFVIHAVPAFLTWTLRWNANKFEKNWPGVFGMPLNEDIANSITFMDMIIPCLTFHGSWLFISLSWYI